MTKTLAFCSLKGGTGKTTLSYNILERAVNIGLKSAVVDFDPRQGSLELLEIRQKRGRSLWDGAAAEINAAGADELERLLATNDYDLVVCDLPGSENIAMLRVLRQADLIVSPVGVGALDTVGGRDLADNLETGGLKATFIANHLPAHRTWEERFHQDLTAMGLEPCPVILRQRSAYFRSVEDGYSVCEWSRTSAAAREVNNLWRWVAKQLELPSGEMV